MKHAHATSRINPLLKMIGKKSLVMATSFAFIVAVPAVSNAATTSGVSPTTATTPAAATQSSAHLPFDMPSTQTLRGSSKKVFAHYMSSVTGSVSIDNRQPEVDYITRNFLDPNGEGGKHATYGGFWRDRPLPRTPLVTTNWRLEDMKTEINQAISSGLDGFTLDILTWKDAADVVSAQRPSLLLQAAEAVDPGFKIVLMPDMSAGPADKTPAQMAEYMAELGASPSAYRLSDGRLVVSPWLAERKDAAYWQEFIQIMKNTYRISVAFYPVFQNFTNFDSYKPFTYGTGNWGARSPRGNNPESKVLSSSYELVKKYHGMGIKWMQPVAVQDARPRSGVFDEAENTTNLRNTWKITIDSGADWVQLATWNDYSENSHMNPSANHGWSYLDINAYYTSWFKTGVEPTIKRDVVYLSHRTQTIASKQSFPQTKVMTLRASSGAARDKIEALTFLTKPANVSVKVGPYMYTCKAPAGVSACTVPLSKGNATAIVWTAPGKDVAKVTSPYAIAYTPTVQNYNYYAVSSGRNSGI